MRRVIARAGTVFVEDVAAPSTPINGYLVRATRSLISPGTELALVAGTRDASSRAQPLGYSLVGTVVDAGVSAPPLAPGTLVACAGYEYSPHAELAAVPTLMATAVPAGVDADAAAFTTLGAVAVHALRQGRVALGEYVAIIGLGVLGQVLVQVAVAAGARAAGADVLALRAEAARRLGAEVTSSTPDDAFISDVRRWTGGLGVDCVLLCTSGGEGMMDLAAGLCRDRGRIVVVGTPALTMSRDALFAKELQVTIARAYGPGRYDRAYEIDGIDYPPGYVRWTQERNRAEFLRLLAHRKVDVAPLITHRFPLGDAPAAYDALRDPAGSTLGVLLTYP